MCLKKSTWLDPIALAKYIDTLDSNYVFLYSSLRTNYSGRYSFLAFNPKAEVFFLNDLEQNLLHTNDSWFGFLGYEIKNHLENLLTTKESFIDLPELWMATFATIIQFDHQEKEIQIFADSSLEISHLLEQLSCIYSVISVPQPVNNDVFSTMNQDEYLHNVTRTIDAIKRGDFFQANITRKFYGHIIGKPIEIFHQLCRISPSPYSSLMRFGDVSILSSSPEMFFQLNEGIAETRPIKGSAARFDDPEKDHQSYLKLQNSAKDKSENLMIVDLMRNDFAKSSKAGTVTVEDLFGIYSYKTIHHMYSIIKAHKRNDVSTLEFIKNCFPPGSVTGAPKIQAMQWCAEIEKVNRSAYCGSIGYFSKSKADMSVTIRTIIMQDNKFEFQVGGAITAESKPIAEWHETLIKARAMAKVLGIKQIDGFNF